MATITIVYWRDIPAQVIAKPERMSGRRSAPGSGPSPVKKELSLRFQEAIDRAAMHAGCSDSDKYLEEWRRETRECTPEENENLELTVKQIVESIDREFSDELLKILATAGGVKP
ncbi:MAG: virulence factor [Proteobacteria bacterium]|nr:virulence factor [Pseudomonadota bacterium]